MKFDGLDIQRAMAIYAHPDDAEFGMAGTVAKWCKAGVEFTYCMVTNGASGSDDETMTREKLRDTRYDEQRAAAKILGVKNTVFLGYEDGYLYPTIEVRRDVARQIRIHKPDVLFTMDPTMRIGGNYINHPDHIAAAEVTLRSINPDASTRQMFPELWKEEHLEPHKPKALFLMAFDEAATVIDISAVMETKVKALRAHSSQLWPGAEDMIRGWAKETGKRKGYKAGESFKVVRFDEPPGPPRTPRAGRKTTASSRGRRGVQSRSRRSTRAPAKRTPSRRKRAR
jgi:LmbE family N-acetylglucosaminyl deacetylase